MENEKQLIVEFPKYLIDGVLDSATIHEILYYSIYKQSLLIDYSIENVAEDAIINYYNSFHEYDINKHIVKLMDLQFIGKQESFVESTDEEENEMIKVFELSKVVERVCIELYSIKKVMKHFGVESYPSYILKEGRRIFKESLEHPNKEMMSVNIGGVLAFKKSIFISAANNKNIIQETSMNWD